MTSKLDRKTSRATYKQSATGVQPGFTHQFITTSINHEIHIYINITIFICIYIYSGMILVPYHEFMA